VLITAAAIVAALSKRNGIPLLAIAFLVIGISVATRLILGRNRIALAALSTGLGAVGTGLYLTWDRLERASEPLLTFWGYALVMRRQLSDVNLESVLLFLKYAVDSSWLIAGWLRFPAPDFWNMVAGLITVGGLTGACLFSARSSAGVRAMWLAWLFVGVHVGSLLLVSFAARSAPQGRYFFAAAMPMSVLLWIGLTYWSPRHVRGYAQAGIVTLVAALDVAAFMLVLIPAYR
jgi:hypothetical protein